MASSAVDSSQVAQLEKLQRVAQCCAGAVAGLVNTLVMSPLDVAKTRLQAQSDRNLYGRPRYKGMVHALQTMLREEGILAYYRGLNASLWAFIPNWSIYFLAYEELKRRLGVAGGKTRKATTPLAHMSAAVGAGALTALSTSPFWVIKTRMQIDIARGAQRRYRTVPHGFRRIVAEENVLSLYKGITPTIVGLVHVGVQFPMYEALKSWMTQDKDENWTTPRMLVASSISKVTASIVAYPHEVIRTRLQVDRSVGRDLSELQVSARLVKEIWRCEGLRGLYRGLGTNLFRTVPACMVTFTSYELASRYITRRATAGAQTPYTQNDYYHDERLNLPKR